MKRATQPKASRPLLPCFLYTPPSLGVAAYWAQCRQKKTVLPGLLPSDPDWLGLMSDCGVLEHIDAVGVHGLPGGSESNGAAGKGRWGPFAPGWRSSDQKWRRG